MAILSAGTSTDGEYDGASVVNIRRTRSHVAGIHYSLYDLNFDKNKGSTNFRHKGTQPSRRPQHDRSSQTATRGYIPEFKPNLLIPLDLNEISDRTGYYVQRKPEKTIYKTEHGYLFGIVTSNGERLWESKKGDYPNKVIYKTVDGQNKVKVYFPEPMPPPRMSSLKVVRPVRDQSRAIDRSRPRYKHPDPSKVAIEITDPHRPDYKFYRYVDANRIPDEAIPKFKYDDTTKEAAPMDPLAELQEIDPALRVRFAPGYEPSERRRFQIPLPMSMNIDVPPDYEPEPEVMHGPRFRPKPKPEPKTDSELEPKPEPKTDSDLEPRPESEPEHEPKLEPELEDSGYEDDEPDMRHLGVIKYITLNIQDKQTTRKYRFFEDIRTQTGFYFAKIGYLFDKVQLTRQYHALAHDLYYQWKAKKVFAKMVMVNGIDDVTPFVAIFLTDDQILFYTVAYINRIHLGTKRYQPDSELNTDDHPPNVRIFTISRSGEKRNDVSKYEVSKYNVPNGTHAMASSNLFYHFTFKRAKYLKITINKRLLWERTNGMRPQSLYYFKNLNLAVLEFDYHSYNVYKFQTDMWFQFHLD
ncbi:hypothetical protein MACJ_001650 [Theileria orientalis]|uniref:Uncharacterized protein n=1 Tax=Theileria orientalis TaxID=68886 RepID=A0A976M906_THEOR|nr:hypothetical protein MACJ_001650 [Theileria orientalis]